MILLQNLVEKDLLRVRKVMVSVIQRSSAGQLLMIWWSTDKLLMINWSDDQLLMISFWWPAFDDQLIWWSAKTLCDQFLVSVLSVKRVGLQKHCYQIPLFGLIWIKGVCESISMSLNSTVKYLTQMGQSFLCHCRPAVWFCLRNVSFLNKYWASDHVCRLVSR